MGLVKAASLRIDLSIGKENTGMTDLFDLDATGEPLYNFSLIDDLALGLQSVKVSYKNSRKLCNQHARTTSSVWRSLGCMQSQVVETLELMTNVCKTTKRNCCFKDIWRWQFPRSHPTGVWHMHPYHFNPFAKEDTDPKSARDRLQLAEALRIKHMCLEPIITHVSQWDPQD